MTDERSVAREALSRTLKLLKLSDWIDWITKVGIPLLGAVCVWLLTGNIAIAGPVGVMLFLVVLGIAFALNFQAVRVDRAITRLSADYRGSLDALRRETNERLQEADRAAAEIFRSLDIGAEDPHALVTRLDEALATASQQRARLDQIGRAAQRAVHAEALLLRFHEFDEIVERNARYSPRPIDYPLPLALTAEQRWAEEVAHIRRQFQSVQVPSLADFPAAAPADRPEVRLEPGDEQFFRTEGHKGAYLSHLASVEATRDTLVRMRMDLEALTRWTTLKDLAPVDNRRV